jgi:bifunctional DNase/RNase
VDTRVPLVVKGLTYSERPSGSYALVLGPEDGLLRIPVVIGAFEAQSIAIALDRMAHPPRPMTHDLFQTMLAAFHVQIREVTLTALEEGIFRATLVCDQEGHEWRFDARPSDAIAMALRQQAPLFATQEVVRSAGEQMDNGASDTPAPAATAAHAAQPTDQLHLDLQEALTNEDYERAASLRDELQRRGAL